MVIRLGLFLLLVIIMACSQKAGLESLPSGPPGFSVLDINVVDPPLIEEYRIQPHDELDVKFFFNPELNEEKLPVRPDGRISLQLAGEVMAAGRTPAELTNQLKVLYNEELKKPELTVIVKSFAQHRVYVDGAVEHPSEVEIRGSLTPLQAIASAGGVKDTGQLQEVLIIRRGPKSHPLVFKVDLEDILQGNHKQADIRLAPYDVVYVPQSAIADVNQFVNLYIRKNIPIGFGTFFTLN